MPASGLSFHEKWEVNGHLDQTSFSSVRTAIDRLRASALDSANDPWRLGFTAVIIIPELLWSHDGIMQRSLNLRQPGCR